MKLQLENVEARLDQLMSTMAGREEASDVIEADMEPIDIMISDDFQILDSFTSSQEVEPEDVLTETPQEEVQEVEMFQQKEQAEEIFEEKEEIALGEPDQEEIVEELVDEEEPVAETELEVEAESVAEIEAEEETETEIFVTEEEPVDDDLPFDDDYSNLFEPVEEERPVVVEAPKPVQILLQKAEATTKATVADAMVSKQPWRTDVPGAPVKDVRGAIALVDRVIFINKLFGEDPVRFQNDLNVINQSESFQQAVDYLLGNHPDWNLDSDVVYRFMMAVRRKLN